MSAFFTLNQDLTYDLVAAGISNLTYNVAQLWYRDHYSGSFKSSLRVLGCQQDLLDMLESLKRRMMNNKLVDIYVEHIDGYESDTASLKHMSEGDDDELYLIRKQRLEARVSRGSVEDDEVQVEGQFHSEYACQFEEVEMQVEDEVEHAVMDEGWEQGRQNLTEPTKPTLWTGMDEDVPPVAEEEDSDGMHSEYPSSDEYDSPTMHSDNEGLERIAPFFPTFNAFMDPFKFVPLLGMKFNDPSQLKDCLRYYAVENKRNIRFVESKTKMILAKCKPKCEWRLYANWMRGENSFQVKSLREKHRCSKAYRIGIANSRWLAKVFHNKIINNPKISWKLLKEEVKDRYHFEVTLDRCGKAKRFALGEVDEIMREHYAKLWDYGAELKLSIPGTTVSIMVNRPTLEALGHFQRMYVCFGPLKKCWREGCRPVIGVDGCFLKNYCKGELLTAIGRDGNNWMFPIAWAVVESETKDAWIWFLQQLSDDLFLGDGGGLTIISDQQKGLESAIELVLPRSEHRMCVRHVYANFRAKFSGGHLKNLYWQAAKCGTEREFNDIMDKIGAVCPEAKEYLTKKKNPKQWCRAWYGTNSGCDSVENNMCETFNGVIVEARALKIIDMLEDIRRYITRRMQLKLKEIMTWDSSVCPRILKKMEKLEENYGQWRVQLHGATHFEVNNGNRKGYKVDLEARICSCRLWDVSGIPCIHALAVLIDKEEHPAEFVSAWFSTEKIKKCYGEFIMPFNGEKLWPKTGYATFLPPKDRRMHGRPKKARRKNRHESPQKGNGKSNKRPMEVPLPSRVSKVGKGGECSICKKVGHNKRTCKERGIIQEEGVFQSSTMTNGSSQGGVRSTSTLTTEPISQAEHTQGSTTGVPTFPVVPIVPATTNKSVQGSKGKAVQKGPKTKATKSLAELLKEPTLSSMAKAKPPIQRQAPVKRIQPPKGVGVYICPLSGDNYYKSPGAKKGKWVPRKQSTPQSTLPTTNMSSQSSHIPRKQSTPKGSLPTTNMSSQSSQRSFIPRMQPTPQSSTLRQPTQQSSATKQPSQQTSVPITKVTQMWRKPFTPQSQLPVRKTFNRGGLSLGD
ncbi:hypothetical protein ACHQM5_000759 [Ranunculus cassubicifolius]